MLNVYKLMAEIRNKEWLLNTRWTEITRVDDNTIEIQTPRIKTEGLTDLQEMDQVNIERIAGAKCDGITIVIEVQ